MDNTLVLLLLSLTVSLLLLLLLLVLLGRQLRKKENEVCHNEQ